MNAQGEDVVAGIRTPKPMEELKDVMPGMLSHLFNRIIILFSIDAAAYPNCLLSFCIMHIHVFLKHRCICGVQEKHRDFRESIWRHARH